MTDKPKKGMAALLAEQQQQVAAERARPARGASEARPARPSNPPKRPPPAASSERPPRAESPTSPSRTASSAKAAGPGKAARLRSWYMTPASADALAEAVDDLHHATRAPKYEVLAAIVRHALADLGAVEAELRARQAVGE